MVMQIAPISKAHERVLQDKEELHQQFNFWRMRVDFWMRYAFPGNPISSVMAGTGTIYETEAVQSIASKRSRFISEWVGSRGETLRNRRTASKTNILPNTYGSPGSEKLIELGHGIFNELNRSKVRGMGGFSWDYNLKNMGTWLGKEAFMVRVYDDGSGTACVEAPFIDPYNLSHDIDVNDGEQLRVVRDMTIKWGDVPNFIQSYSTANGWGASETMTVAKPDGKKDSEYTKINDYWRRDPIQRKGQGSQKRYVSKIWHAVMIDGKPIRERVAWDDHGYTTLPIVISARPSANHEFQDISHADKMSTKDAKTYYHAEPFYARAINLLIFLEAMEGLRADGAAASLPIFLRNKGDSNVDTRLPELKPFGEVNQADNEVIKVMEGLSRGQFTLDKAIEQLNSQLNQIYPDYLVSPDIASGTSGYAYNSQISQAKMYMVPWSQMDEAAKYALLESVIDQHRNIHPNLSFNLAGILPSGGRFSSTFAVKDYPTGSFEIDIQEPAEIPGEELQNQTLAIQGVESGLVSKWRARVTKLGMSDPQAEQERIDDEMFHASPVNQNAMYMERLSLRADELSEKAQSFPRGSKEWKAATLAFDAVNTVLVGAKMQYTMPPGGAQAAGQTANPQNMALPPQQTTDDPNMKAMAQGKPPTGTEGRSRPEGVR